MYNNTPNLTYFNTQKKPSKSTALRLVTFPQQKQEAFFFPIVFFLAKKGAKRPPKISKITQN